MICIRCNHDSKYPERPNRICPNCKQEFAFEPRAGDMFTDKAFQSALDAVSGQGKIRWTPKHLHYELCRRRKGFTQVGYMIALIGGSVVMGVLGGFVLHEMKLPEWLVILPLLWFANFMLNKAANIPLTVPEATFHQQLNRWQQVYPKPPGLITLTERRQLRPKATESDLADYSFDRVVMCDQPETVDLLLANNFHFENNCAILAMGKYPPEVFDTVLTMLKRNPKLEIYALHDATVTGCKMAYKLAHQKEWFKGLGRVIDVGLRPAHIKPLKKLWRRHDITIPPDVHGLSEAEVKWLSKYSVELSAIRPEQVLKRLYKAINGQVSQENQTDTSTSSSDSDGYWVDDNSFSADAGASDGGADGFG